MLKKIFYAFVLCWCCTCLFVRCYYGLAGMESAKTIGEGDTKIGGAINYSLNSPLLFRKFAEDPSIYEPDYSNSVSLNFDATIGISEQFDVKLQLSTEGALGLRGKYEFTNKKSVVAFALGAGGGVSYGSPFIDIPAYISIHPSPEEGFSFYFSPRYVRVFLDKKPIKYDASHITFIGTNLGLLFRIDDLEFALDYGVFDMNVQGEEKRDFGNIALGMNWRF